MLVAAVLSAAHRVDEGNVVQLVAYLARGAEAESGDLALPLPKPDLTAEQ